MGPPRRARSNSSVSNYSPNLVQRQQQSPYQPPATPSQHLGMSPASRYHHNMKVLRRRDPSIVSIFDQFSHVCVYHHNGDKWEKQGFEGSMFLYERNSYPPYGFYILNRVGMDDYIQRLYPEDNIGAHGNYLMLRSYPEFTARRLAEARTKLSPSEHEGESSKFAKEYSILNPEKLQDMDKGKSLTVGLWCFATDAREPLNDKNIPYPEEFRYGPDRPPPPNLHSSTRPNGKTHSRSVSSASDASISEVDEDRYRSSSASSSLHRNGKANSNGHESDLDKLFAKLGGGPPSQATNTPSTVTVDSLFASIGSIGSTQKKPDPIPTPSATPSRGLSLLDTIFASATPPPARDGRVSRAAYQNGVSSPPSLPASTHSQSSSSSMSSSLSVHKQTAHIVSPTPTTTSVPQILNQDVISSLLGLPPSRASSVAASSSSSRLSGKDRYEGDNESSDGDDLGASDGGYSESSTVLDADADVNIELQAAGSSSGIPLLAVPYDNDEHRQANGNILGDATPRAALRPMSSDITAVSELLSACAPSSTSSTRTRTQKRTSQSLSAPLLKVPKTLASPSANTTPTIGTSSLSPAPSAKTITARPLVPFEADSELWPYPRAPVDDRALDADSDVVELDFADTSALRNPHALSRHLQDQDLSKGKKQKKGKRERAADREREREEIEKSWDVPAPPAASPPPRSVPYSIPSSPEYARVPNGNGKAKEARGSASQSASGIVDKSQIIDTNVAYESMASGFALQERKMDLKPLSRSDFLTLIHTDKQFVDTLWRDYTSRYA
ncbi:hypothetical protein SERLA73DRAFT_69271 [Serpula lacrymans var. lacrymans S7.3]|uniref:Uncharacterized protein n=1 Tax=Serpula lacrymans var. lacrymans (strain S7.3) TaxID=936435 RepID=F8PIM6_SERL3|nr:hypothetical protein SERLA73DRAFT_69271 [Serpula lacrymans var. lacrymans S7.3]